MLANRAHIALLTLIFAGSLCAGSPPGPADDELFAGTFEGVGWMRNFPASYGFVVPSDGLPVMLQDDLDALYLAKCLRLDCATGTVRSFLTRVDNRKRAALALGSDGLPILVYWDIEVSALQFGRCDDTSCKTLSTEAVYIGDVIEMALIPGSDGFPLIALFDGMPFTQELLLYKCNDLGCDDIAAPIVLDQASTGSRIAMDLNGDGSPVFSYSNIIFLAGGQTSRTLTVITCDTADCTGDIRREPVDDGFLFEELSFGSLHTSLAMLVPDGRPPVLFGVLNLVGNQAARIVAITCNTLSCDDVEDPEILGNIGNYRNHLSAVMSADGLPMVLGDIANSGVEFIQCQTLDCLGAKTNRVLAHPKFNSFTTSAVLQVAADGNPTAALRAAADSAAVIYCRDPECEAFAVY